VAVTIKLAGKEYRIRSDASEEWLQQVASYVDQAMQKIRDRTETIDSLEIALLAALNLAREVLYLKNQVTVGEEPVSNSRLRDLIDQIELELPATDASR
jgi:cell division protein ZapA